MFSSAPQSVNTHQAKEATIATTSTATKWWIVLDVAITNIDVEMHTMAPGGICVAWGGACGGGGGRVDEVHVTAGGGGGDGGGGRDDSSGAVQCDEWSVITIAMWWTWLWVVTVVVVRKVER